MGNDFEVPIYVKVGFMQGAQFNQQHPNIDTFYQPSLVNAHCITGSKKYPDPRMTFISAIDKFSQAYGGIVSCFRHLAKDNVLQPYLAQKDYISFNSYPEGNSGYILFVSDIRHHQNVSSAQTIKVRFDSRPAVPAERNLIGYALLLTDKLVSASSDGRRQLDLV